MADVPQRIVSTSIAGDEMLLALLSRKERLVATSALATNKLYSNIFHLPHNRPVATSIEKVTALRPDLVVCSVFNRQQFLFALARLGLPKIKLNKFSTIEHILANIKTLGKHIGEQERARNMLVSLRQRLANIGKLPAKPRLLNFFADNTLMGSATVFDSIVQQAGAINLARSIGIKGFAKVNVETLATLKPDFIVIPTEIYAPAKIIIRLKQMQGWKNLLAVRKNKFIYVPARELLSTSQYAVNASEKIYAALQRAQL